MVGKVKVACKLPNGLTVDHEGARVTLNGANHEQARFGFGFTTVDEDWFKSWAEGPAKDFPPIVNGSIYAMPADKAQAAARERQGDASVQTGQEPLDPEKPAPGVEPTEETRAQLKGRRRSASADDE